MMIKAVFKSLTGEKENVKAIWKLLYTMVGFVSSIYAFSVLLKEVEITDVVEAWVRAHIYIVILVSAIAAIVCRRERLRRSYKVSGSDLQIAFCVNDLFNITADSYVIPTNTFFRTKMEGEYISSKSVQGRFQEKFFKNNHEELDKLISESLKNQKIEGIDSCDRFGDVKKYPVGTVAKIDHKRKHYYFVAISDVNEFGKPIGQAKSNIDMALHGLMQAVKSFGHCDSICTPLIGTGRAAIKDATIEKVFQITVNCFVESQEKTSQKVIICINPKDYVEDRADISRLNKYLAYKCEFPNTSN